MILSLLPRRNRMLCSFPHLFFSQIAFIYASDALFWPSVAPYWKEKQAVHLHQFDAKKIDQKFGSKLAQLTNRKRLDVYLDNILVHRPVGSKNHSNVAEFIMKKMEKLNYHVQTHEFQQYTVIGLKKFRNIIATLDPLAPRRLVLACHYDSKYFQEFTFMGATDSAVPCAIMLDVAETLQPYIDRRNDTKDVTLQLIFFDGEEAFVDWSDNDSLYGSRQLAQHWKKSYMGSNPMISPITTELERIDVMILLDLLGGSKSETRVPNYRGTNFEPIYQALAQIEQWLINSGRMKGGRFEMLYGLTRGSVADDHVPFLSKNVNVVHLIPSPFPWVWHTEKDKREYVDMATVEDWTSIMRIFTALYLRLQP